MPTRTRKTVSKKPSTPKVATTKTDTGYTSFTNNLNSSKSYILILVILLVVAAFFIGMLYTKVQYLENSQTAQQNPQAAKSTGSLNVAKEIGIDPVKFKSCLDSNKYATAVSVDLADGQKIGVSATPTTFIDGYPIVGAQPYSVFKTTIDQELAKSQTERLPSSNLLVKRAYAQANAPISVTPTPTRVSIDPGNLPIMGNKNAPVTIIEFADFQCPYCERWFKDVEPGIIKNYVNTGKAKLAFINYAILGQDSVAAAEGAYCANEQGKFWQYHDYLYSHQGQENSGWVSKTNLES